jgi:hypothetical protein
VRKILVALLVAVGIFGLVLAGLLRFYAPSRAEKTPLNLDIKQVANGPGKILNAATGQLEDFTLNATRRVRTDSALSDSRVTVVQETLCVVKNIGNPPECVDAQDSQHRLVSFTTDRVAADRKTGESVNDPKYATNIDGDASATHTGLSYKWPLHAKKITYKFFDPVSRKAADARFIGTDKLKGMKMYKYEAVIDKMDLPIGPNIPGSYADTRTVWVEPVTGVIVQGTEVQKRWLADGSPAFDTTLTFNPASVDYQAKQASDGRAKIKQLTVIFPLISLLVGLAALAGAFLLYRGTSGNGHRARPGQPAVRVPAPPR